MSPETAELHRRAALATGREASCGRKVDHRSEDKALGAAGLNRRNARSGDPKPFEPYPCPFCGGWHVGREMPEAELRAAAAAAGHDYEPAGVAIGARRRAMEAP